MGVDLERLARFLVMAKKATYASKNVKRVQPERPGHKELEFEDEDLYYRDSYVGFFQAPGMEEVRLGGHEGETIWTMSYSGGMSPEFQGNLLFAKETFGFLKKALALVPEGAPFRGPEELIEGDWKYVSHIEGNIELFEGHESILYKGKKVFHQVYAGGLVKGK